MSKPLDTQIGGDHYKSMAIQPVEFCQKNNMNYCESNIIKYVCRHKAKAGKLDLEKVIHYAELLIEMEYPEEPEKGTLLTELFDCRPNLSEETLAPGTQRSWTTPHYEYIVYRKAEHDYMYEAPPGSVERRAKDLDDAIDKVADEDAEEELPCDEQGEYQCDCWKHPNQVCDTCQSPSTSKTTCTCNWVKGDMCDVCREYREHSERMP